MTELKNIDAELSLFRSRLWAAAAFVLGCFGLLVVRLTVLQIERHRDLASRAESHVYELHRIAKVGAPQKDQDGQRQMNLTRGLRNGGGLL